MLEIDNVSLKYGVNTIPSDLYFKAEIGKTTCLLGRNGSGKTSLLKIIFGTLKPNNKLIRINKSPISKPFYKTNLVSYLTQEHFCPTHLKLSQIAKDYNTDTSLFFDYFPEMLKHKNSKINMLSGGELRLFETYLILNSKSKYIILDEPFSYIMPIHIERIKALINKLKLQKAIIITDHMYHHIIDIYDDLYVLHNSTCKLVKGLNQLVDYNYLKKGTLA